MNGCIGMCISEAVFLCVSGRLKEEEDEDVEGTTFRHTVEFRRSEAKCGLAKATLLYISNKIL